MSDLKVDGIIASTGTNTALTLQGKGTGTVDIGDGALSFPDADGSADQVIKTDGSGTLAFTTVTSGFTLGTEQATTSGTSVTFGSIPSGTTMILMTWEGVSFSTCGDFDITIGDSGGLETSGYDGAAVWVSAAGQNYVESTAAWLVNDQGTSDLMVGTVMLTLKDSSNFTWTQSHIMSGTANNQVGTGSGVKSLSAELTQISVSGGTFDAGSINIMYQ